MAACELLRSLAGSVPDLHQREGELLRELRLVRDAIRLAQRTRRENELREELSRERMTAEAAK